MFVRIIVESGECRVLRQQLNKFYRSQRCVSKIALELMRRSTAAQSAEPVLMRDAGVEKSERSRDIRNRAVHDAIYYRESSPSACSG
jgi:hypothetical protein